MWCNYLPLERLLPVIVRSCKFNFCSLDYTHTLSLIAANWLKFSHSPWLVRLINILFLLFISFPPLLFHSSQPTQFSSEKNLFLFFLRSATSTKKQKKLDHYRGITNHLKGLLSFEGGNFDPPHRTNHPILHQVIWSFYVVFMRLCKWVDHRWVTTFSIY